jgi:hypothetical protein
VKYYADYGDYSPAQDDLHHGHPQLCRQMLNEAAPETGVLVPVEYPATAGPLPGDIVTVPPAVGSGWYVAEKLSGCESSLAIGANNDLSRKGERYSDVIAGSHRSTDAYTYCLAGEFRDGSLYSDSDSLERCGRYALLLATAVTTAANWSDTCHL